MKNTIVRVSGRCYVKPNYSYSDILNSYGNKFPDRISLRDVNLTGELKGSRVGNRWYINVSKIAGITISASSLYDLLRSYDLTVVDFNSEKTVLFKCN